LELPSAGSIRFFASISYHQLSLAVAVKTGARIQLKPLACSRTPMSADSLTLLEQYLRGDAPLEATAQSYARQYAAEGWGLYLTADETAPADVRARMQALWARYLELIGQDREAAG
jgi:hypothetical protein